MNVLAFPRSLTLLAAAAWLTGCAFGDGDGSNGYPLLGSSLCPVDLAEGSLCDPSTDAACALPADLGVACRCAAADDGTARVRCDVPSPVPPLPPGCSADVAPGTACDPRLADRVCALPDGRCVCTDSSTDPAVPSYVWSCETPPLYCPRGATSGAQCVGFEGSTCQLAGGGRCRCNDDPAFDRLPIWECSVPPPAPACDGSATDPAVATCSTLGERCDFAGRSCVCAYAADGSTDLLAWQCESPPAAECSDEIRSGERVSCDAIGASCTAEGLSCRCVEDPRVPAGDRGPGYWLCEGVPPPPSECGADVGNGVECRPVGATCSLPGASCVCMPDPRDPSVPAVESGTWVCEGPPPPPEPAICAEDLRAGMLCGAIGERCARPDGTECRCVEDASVPAVASGIWECGGPTAADR